MTRMGLYLVLLLSLPIFTPAGQYSLFVAKNGSDTNPGSREQLFATLQAARSALHALKKADGLPKGGVTVWVGGGDYYLTQPFTLTAEDSGTTESPITYRAYLGETVRLIGGQPVTKWDSVANKQILQRLDPGARGHVMQTDLAPLGYRSADEAFTPGKRSELFFDDKPMTLSRWPNTGFVKVADVTAEGAESIGGFAGSTVGKFHYTEDRPARWAEEKEIWLHGYWFWDWSDGYGQVASIDPATRTIALTPPYHHYGYRKGQRYYAENLLCELNSPGECYLDRATGILYFWPPSMLDGKHAVISMLPTLVQMQNVSEVTFRGFIFEATRNTAVTITAGTHVCLAGCTIRNTGAWGVQINGGAQHCVLGCDITQTGVGGVNMTGGDRKTLTPAGHVVDNCVIHGFGRLLRTYQPAVNVNGVGNRVTHNLIYDGPHNAILMTGNDHLVEGNEIYNICYEAGDVGAFYIGRDWTERGNIVRGNYFHHISGSGMYGASAVYLDDCASGTTVIGNLFYKAGMAVEIGGGRDNTVENNVFVECSPAVHADSRALLGHHAWVEDGGVLKNELLAMPYSKPPWSERYPQLLNTLNDEPGAPKGNRIAHNISSGGRWLDADKQTLAFLHVEQNLVGQDPHFVDAALGSFGLRDDSPAFAMGITPLDLSHMGPYADELRASWPVARETPR